MLKAFQINSMLHIGEHTSVEQRDLILHVFQKGIDLQGSLCSILIMMPIRAVGINLADANWLILMVNNMFSTGTKFSLMAQQNIPRISLGVPKMSTKQLEEYGECPRKSL
jgi:hypothetical protein